MISGAGTNIARQLLGTVKQGRSGAISRIASRFQPTTGSRPLLCASNMMQTHPNGRPLDSALLKTHFSTRAMNQTSISGSSNMTQNVSSKVTEYEKRLNELWAFTGQSKVQGLSLEELKPFLESDPDLRSAIDEAHRLAFNPDPNKPHEVELQRLMQRPEAEAIHACQEGLLNFYPSYKISPAFPLASQGGWYLSFQGVHYDVAGYGKDPFGHNAPEIVEALRAPSVSKNMMYSNVHQKILLDHLANALGVDADSIQFQAGNTGSDGMELALVHVDAYQNHLVEQGLFPESEKPHLLVLERSFHGRTRRPAEISDSTQTKYQQAFVKNRQLYNVTTVSINDVEALKTVFAEANEQNKPFMAMFMEPIQGEGKPGVAITPEFWQVCVNQAETISEEKPFKTLLVADSVQAGGWRSGEFSLMSYPEYQAVGRPDFEIFAKTIGGGLEAVSLLVMKKEAGAYFKQGVYGNTRAGNPHSLGVVNQMFQSVTPEVKENIKARSQQFLDGFAQLQQRYPHIIKAVRGTGLLLGLKVDTQKAPVIGPDGLETMLREQGIDIIHGGKDDHLRLTPNFLITKEQTELVLNKIEQALRASAGLDHYQPLLCFGPDYLDTTLRALPENPINRADYRAEMSQARANELEALQAGQWHNEPLCSVINGQRFDGGAKEKTFAALSCNPTGSKIVLEDQHFHQWKTALSEKANQPLTLNPETLAQLTNIVEDFRDHQNSATHTGQLLAHLAYDFETDKTAEFEERIETGVRAKAFDEQVRQQLLEGDLSYNVSAAGVIVSPVINFGSLLDVQQKVMHAVGTGVPATWVVRSGEAAQQSTREVMQLQARLIDAGLGEWLNIVVLNDAQRDELFGDLGVTTLMTGRSSSAVAIQGQAPDSSTSGSGLSGDFTLDPNISQSADFATRLREDATVATNGRQCTALQGGSVNGLGGLDRVSQQVLFDKPQPKTALESANEQFNHQVWHGAYQSAPPSMPEGVKVLAEEQGMVVYQADKRFLDEQYTWGINGIGLHDNGGSLDALCDLLRQHSWLSIGYMPNMETLDQELEHFSTLLNVSKATVGTFSGDGQAGCVFSAPQNPGEIFAERTQHRIGKVLVGHSPRHAPVPRGAALWGPSDRALEGMANTLGDAENRLAEALGLASREVGYLNVVNTFIRNNLGPKPIERAARGPSIEGIAYRAADEQVALYIPETCYSLQSRIQPVDIAVRLALMGNTSMKQNVTSILVHPQHAQIIPYIERYLEDKGIAIPVTVEADPEQAVADEVEPVNATHIRGVFKMPDDVVAMAGCRMMHAKFLGAPQEASVRNAFVQAVSDQVGWLTCDD